MAELSKTARASMRVAIENTRINSYWVFSRAMGTGKAKLPVAGFGNEEEATSFAVSIGGYVVNMKVGAR